MYCIGCGRDIEDDERAIVYADGHVCVKCSDVDVTSKRKSSIDVCPICAMLGGGIPRRTMRHNRPPSVRAQTVPIMDNGHWTCNVCRTYMADPARSALMLTLFGVENFDAIEDKEQLYSLLESDNAVQSKLHYERRAVEGLQFILFGAGNES